MRDAGHLSDLEIQALLDDALDAAEVKEARLHLAACRGCARRVEAQSRLFTAIESWGDAPPPHDLALRVVRSLADRRTPVGLQLATLVEAGLAILLIALAWPVLTTPLASVTLPTIAGIGTLLPDLLAGLSEAIVASEALLHQASASMEAWLPLAREWMTLWPAIIAGALLVAILGNSILFGVRPRRM